MLSLNGHQVEGEIEATLLAFISESGLKAGDRLPPERELTEKFGLTRASLRKALDTLERDGAIWRHVGKGTFVSAHRDGKSGGRLIELGRQLTPFRMMRARLAIEPALAREAAVNASGEAMTHMKVALERAHSTTSWRDYEIQDDLFHRSVAEASDNPLLLALFDQLNQVRRAVAWGNVTRKTDRPAADYTSFSEHEAIAAAISDRNPEAAYDAMRQHLRSVAERLFAEV